MKTKSVHLLPALLCTAFALSLNGPAQAQLAVNPDALWLKPGVGLTGTSGNYTAWQSQAASPGNYTLSTSSPSNFTSDTMGTGNATSLDFGGAGVFSSATLTSGPLTNVFAGGGTIVLAFNPVLGTGAQRLLDTTNQTSVGWDLYWQNSGKIGFRQSFTGTDATWETSASFAADGTYVFTLTYNSDSASNVPTMYLNNTALTLTQFGSNVGTAESDSTRVLRVGGRAGSPGPEGYLGEFGEILIYNSTLIGGNLTSAQNTLYNTYVVPEPSAIALLALGGAAILFVRRRRTKRAVLN